MNCAMYSGKGVGGGGGGLGLLENGGGVFSFGLRKEKIIIHTIATNEINTDIGFGAALGATSFSIFL